MRVLLKTEHKSLIPFESEELNDFTIITGRNGSGKSQLLTLLSNIPQQKANKRYSPLEIIPEIERIQSEGIAVYGNKMADHNQWKNIIKSFLDNYKKLSPELKELARYLVKHKLWTSISKERKNQLLSQEPTYHALLTQAFNSINPNSRPNPPILALEQMVLSHILNFPIEKIFSLISKICQFTGKEEHQLADADFYHTPVEEYLVDNAGLFSSQIEMLFYSYAKRRDSNRRSWFIKNDEHIQNNSIPDAEFITVFPPPWIIINNFLDTHNIDFYVKGIEKTEFTDELYITAEFYKKSTNTSIQLAELSSGEKIIVGLILKLFTSEFYGETGVFPELLILDEPDAFLHPEMTKLMLEVLDTTFVKKYGIKVIITTHSPSTIALAPENSIYQLTNGQNSGLKKIAKDEALKILTGFIPTLSIDYKNHKQVFVESPTDVVYYQNIHDKHQQSKTLPHKLYFISNSAGKGNCTQVYKIVQDLRGAGNKTCYGIVDWDLINEPADNVVVHGLKERYSVENFILDPIYVICLLMDMDNAHKICENVGVDRTYNQFSIGGESQEKLQSIIKYYFGEFEKRNQAKKYESERAIVEYLNGKKIEIPKWYMEMRGHDIVQKVKEIFPALGNKYKNEGDLQSALSTVLTKCYPFVPLTTIQVIESI
jgi:predicted ATPase